MRTHRLWSIRNRTSRAAIDETGVTQIGLACTIRKYGTINKQGIPTYRGWLLRIVVGPYELVRQSAPGVVWEREPSETLDRAEIHQEGGA